MPVERLQKVLARAGVASRRHAEAYIVEGRVRVNGIVVSELGTRVDPRRDKVELDGRRIVLETPIHAILHKPRGVVTTLHDPEGRPALADLVKSLDARVFPVGRLDFHTSGALLVTNDGALAQALLHPRHHVPKVYVCKVRGVPSDAQLDAWRQGVMLHPTESDPDERPVKTLPAQVRILRNAPPGDDAGAGAGSTWLEVTLHEGRTRQIHRMAEATGLFVMRLARLSFGGITTEGLRPGELRHLTDKEVTALRVQYLRPLEMGAIPGAPLHNGDTAATRRAPHGSTPVDEPESAQRDANRARDNARPRQRHDAQPSDSRPTRRKDPRPTRREDPRPTRREDPRPTRREDPRTTQREDPRTTRREDPRTARREDPRTTQREDPRTTRREDVRRDDPRPTRRDDPRRDDARPARRDEAGHHNARPARRNDARRDDARPERRDDARPARRDDARRDDARPERRDDARPARRDDVRREDPRPKRRDTTAPNYGAPQSTKAPSRNSSSPRRR